MNLIFGTRKSINNKYSDWRIKDSYNPIDHVGKGSNFMEEFQFNLNNMHVELPDEEISIGAVQEAIKEALYNKAVFSQ